MFINLFSNNKRIHVYNRNILGIILITFLILSNIVSASQDIKEEIQAKSEKHISAPEMSVFGATSTTDEVLEGRNLKGKRILITGVSAGLGIETARALVAHGANVVGTARDLIKAKTATEIVRMSAATTNTNGGNFELVELDLTSLASVRTCTDKLLTDAEPFDLVIANAGVMATPFGRTSDGFETQFATNHLGHFVLVNRIVPLMQPGSRLVVLSSSAGHRSSDVNLDDPNFDHTPYSPWIAYGRSKTANILFAVEFDRRHRDRGVRATAVHPGGINTELGRHIGQAVLESMIKSINDELAEQGKPLFWFKSIPQGAATSIWAGIVASADEVGGKYCEDCHVTTKLLDGPVHATSDGVSRYALDPDRAAALWAKSEELVGEKF